MIKKLILKINAVYIVLIMVLIYTAVFSFYTIMRHYTFQTHAYDFGIFLNSFWNTLYSGKPYYTTLWEGSRFQNHFGPILYLILPIYAILPRPETLLILQSFVLGLGALPIYWIAKNEINKKAGVIFALLYLAYPALHGINRFDFHEVAFAPTIILFAFHYFKDKRYNLSFAFILLALISREDVAMVIVPMAMLWLWERKDKWSIKDKETIFCISIIFIGLIWFFIATKIIIPKFSAEGYWFVMEYKSSYLLIDTVKKYKFVNDVFLPLLFMPFFNKWILPASPIFGRILFSNRSTRYSIVNQHTALLVPFVFLSSIYFIKYIYENMNIKSLFPKKLIFPILAIMLMISFFISPIKDDITSHYTIQQLVKVPDGGPVSSTTGLFVITPHYKAIDQVINMIPSNASVYTQNTIFPHMADRPNVYYVPADVQIFRGWNNPQTALIVPWKGVGDFDYVLVDSDDTRWYSLYLTDIETIDVLHKNYGLYLVIDGIYLFKKDYNGTTNLLPSLMNTFDNRYLSGYYNGVLASYYNGHNLSETDYLLTDRVGPIFFNWRTNSPIPGIVDKDNFSIRFDSYIYIPQDGNYSFQLFTDGKSRLFFNDQLIIDAWNTTMPVAAPLQSYFNTGLYKIRVDYQDRKESAYIYLKWFTPWKGTFVPIPEEYFYIPKENFEDIIYNIKTSNYTEQINNTEQISGNNMSQIGQTGQSQINGNNTIGQTGQSQIGGNNTI